MKFSEVHTKLFDELVQIGASAFYSGLFVAGKLNPGEEFFDLLDWLKYSDASKEMRFGHFKLVKMDLGYEPRTVTKEAFRWYLWARGNFPEWDVPPGRKLPDEE